MRKRGGSREIWGKICPQSTQAQSTTQLKTDVVHGRIRRSEATRVVDSSRNLQSMTSILTSIQLIRMTSSTLTIPMTTLHSQMKSSGQSQTNLRLRPHRSEVALDSTIKVTWAINWIHMWRTSLKTWRQLRSEADLLTCKSSSSKAGTFSIITGMRLSLQSKLKKWRSNTLM